MLSEKIDHHFNELSPLDFNVFGETRLYDKLKREGATLKTARAFLDHVTIIKEQIDSVVGEEDEHLAVVYNFLSQEEQRTYQEFLERLEDEVGKYIREANG